jgi:hypothetical protein
VRVDVFRNQRAGGNPLPTFFGKIVGINEQGVRATATAEALFGSSTDCVKPFAIPDRWVELRNDVAPLGWSEEDTFERYSERRKRGQCSRPTRCRTPGSGYSPESVRLGGGDYGRRITLKSGSPNSALAPGSSTRRDQSSRGPGGANYRENIATCDTTVIGPAPCSSRARQHDRPDATGHGRSDRARPEANGTRPERRPRRHRGGCMAAPAPCDVSPRLVAIPVFDPDAYDAGRASGRTSSPSPRCSASSSTDEWQRREGYIMTYPVGSHAGMGGVPAPVLSSAWRW